MFLAVFLTLFFGFFILFGVLGLRSYRRLQRVGIKTTATVVALEKVIGHDSNGKTTSYRPIVEFKTKDAQTIKGQINSTRKSVAMRMEKEKAQIDIIYDPAKPSEFSKESRWNEIISMALCIVGFIGVTIGLLGLLGIINMPEGEATLGI